MLQRSSIQSFDSSKIKATPSALEFLNNIDIDDLEYFMYPDKLGNFTFLTTDVGKYEVTLKKSCYDLTSCIKVKIRNEITLSGIYCQTKITSFVGQKLKTLYQIFEEILKFSTFKMTKKVVVKSMEKGYEISKEMIENDIDEHWSKFFSMEIMQGYVSEGASVILHRLLVARHVPDNFSIIVFNQYWELSSATFKALETIKLPISDEKVAVNGIERIVYSAKDYETIWQMYFVPDGHLMSKAQVGSPISMKVYEMTDYVEKDSFLSKPTFSMTELNWEDDMQLISQFLDMKEVNKSKSIKYLKDHMEIKYLMKSFMQAILIRKPANPVEFASRYFITFSSRVKPNYTYENSNSKNIDFLL